MRAHHLFERGRWCWAFGVLSLIALAACGEAMDYVLVDIKGAPRAATRLHLSLTLDGRAAPMGDDVEASRARIAVELRRALRGAATLTIEALGGGACVAARGSLTLQLPRQSSEALTLTLAPVDADCDGYKPDDPLPALRDCDDSDPRIHPGAAKDCGDPSRDWACDGKPRAGCHTCGSDADCTDEPDGLRTCDRVKGVCVQCRSDLHCAAVAGRGRCDLGASTCAGCLSALDCAAAVSDQCTMAPDSRCVCSNNGGMPCSPNDLAAQVCKPGGGCVQCLADSDCPALKFPGIPKGDPQSALLACKASSNRCVQCTSDAHCANNPDGKLVCDPASNLCVQCTTANAGRCSGTTTQCRPDTNRCVQCLSFAADCSPTSADACSATNSCTCKGGAACAGAKPVCDTRAGSALTCVQCTPAQKAQCSGGTTACNGATGVCVQCVDGSTCALPTPTCNTITNRCVQCSGDADCGAVAGKPRCNAANNQCAQCVSFAADCSAATADQCSAAPDSRCVCSNNGNNPCDPGNLSAQVCKPGVGCRQCLSDANCPASKFPGIPKGNPNSATLACNTSSNLCVQCTNDTHCANNVNGHFACDTSKNVCVQCYKDDKYCTGQATNKRCNPTTNVCVQCLTFNTVDCSVASADQCTATPDNRCVCSNNGNNACDANNLAAQVCKPGVGCKQCLSDASCPVAKFPGIPIGKPGATFLACDTGTNVCAQCTNDSYCAGTSKPVCLTPNDICVQCTASNKSACGGATPRCRLDTNACVQCLLDADCAGVAGKPKCSATNVCIAACANDADCVGVAGKPACNTTTGACVQCTAGNKSKCGGATPSCDNIANICVQCGADDATQCVGTTPLCNNVTRTCVQCLAAADCVRRGDSCSGNVCQCKGQSSCNGTTLFCNTNVSAEICVECNVDADCAGNAARPACNKATGVCGQCSVTKKDLCTGTSKPSCNTTTNLCVQCGNDDKTQCIGATPQCNLTTRACVQCLTNADCMGQTCSAANVCQ